jgi:hypothetical protein
MAADAMVMIWLCRRSYDAALAPPTLLAKIFVRLLFPSEEPSEIPNHLGPALAGPEVSLQISGDVQSQRQDKTGISAILDAH